MRHPQSDDDREWEEYNERLGEWMDENDANITPACKEYFDNNQ